ncbi:MAG: ABC transporter ATP-binding protein [Atopobiaceae bacterium]|nr:ABC transporter ATP-binding protein [Atopobiaceae bacterium]
MCAKTYTSRMGGTYTVDDETRGEVLSVSGLDVYYKSRSRLLRPRELEQVLFDVSFSIGEGEIVGLCGESGSGKSTLSTAICGIIPDFSGSISRAERPQMVFQNPYNSLNPAKRIGWLLEEPLRVDPARKWEPAERQARVLEVVNQVGLTQNLLERDPPELPGGQRQRVALAVALRRAPRVLSAAAPVSALDVTIQAQVLELLDSLHERLGLSILFISHDLRVVYQICNRVLIMRKGQIVEQGPVDTVYRQPSHSYTKQLLEAAGLH